MESRMPEPTIRESGEVAVEQTNELFRQADKPLVACLLSELDLEWCISAVRNMPEERQLPWDQIGAMLRDDNALNFCFKLLDARHRPAGACICEYCPGDGVLNVEMLQNFQIQPSILDGNMLKFALYAIVLFLLETEGSGVRLMFPINQAVAAYYVEEHGFLDITDDGSRDILYRSAADLVDWFRRDAALVDGE
ncbi:TPA: hypothetical protein MXC98_001632 [Klebsiella variicola]|nr:hypothetical protein [Klebsiella variicola]